jgi:menaquinone-dependent protoporphyrinogen oxidase
LVISLTPESSSTTTLTRLRMKSNGISPTFLLAVRPSAFFSVSLSAGSRKPAEVEAARALAAAFVKAQGWQPRRVACFARKLAYSQYGPFKRQIMRFIAWREGAPTDTRRDYEFTDWAAVQRFALDVAADVHEQGRSPAVRAAG